MQLALVPAFLAALVAANPVPAADADAVAVAGAVADADAAALAGATYKYCRACNGVNSAELLADILKDLAKQLRREARALKKCGRLPQFGYDVNIVIQNIIAAGIPIDIVL